MVNSIRRVCVYCGANEGFDAVYGEAATALGHFLATHEIGIVYGGGKVGLMGKVADAALEQKGEVIGIIPHHLLAMEVGHPGLTQLIAVESMHERKFRMAELCDAFIALPGGIGTAEELFEVFTWLQLRIHFKPVGLLNVNGYYDLLLQFLDQMKTTGFLKPNHRALLQVEKDPEHLLERLRAFHPDDVATPVCDLGI